MRGIKFGTILCVVITMLSMPLMTVNAKEKVYTIKFATSHPPMIPTGSIPLELEKVIPERTNGRVKFKAYVGSSLYGDYDAPQQLQAGALEMCYGGWNLSSISPGWNAIGGLPFIIDSYEHYLRFCETDAFNSLNSSLEAKGIKYVAQAGTPGFSNAFNGLKPVKTLEDFKGLKMRTPPLPGLIKMCQRLGIQNVAITMAEVNTALQTGVVDGTFTPILKMKGYNLIENAAHATICNATIIPVTFVVNTQFWNSLPEDLRIILQGVFEEYGMKCGQGSRQMDSKFWKIFKADPGTTVFEITGAEKLRWQAKVKPIWDESKKSSDEAKMVIDAIEATRKVK